MGDYGEPFEKEPKGWRPIVGNYCYYGICMINKGAALDMIATSDTLYVVQALGLLKFPLKDLDRAIEQEDAYTY